MPISQSWAGVSVFPHTIHRLGNLDVDLVSVCVLSSGLREDSVITLPDS